MKIFITGATGFVGTNLTMYLSQKSYEVVKVDRYHLSDLGPLLDSESVIIHLAGKAHDLRDVSLPKEYYDANYHLTKQLYDIFLRSNAKTFIFLSSVKAAADSVNGALTEEITANPQTVYGKSKRMAEEYIQAQGTKDDKSYFILRPCMIHGPGNKGNLNMLYKFVAKNIPYPLASYANKRSFLSVENLCFIILALLEGNVTSGIYNLADNEPLATSEVVETISNAISKKAKLWKVPKSLIAGLAKVGDLLHLPLTSERLLKLTEDYVVSNQKIKKAINKDLPLSARQGLSITIKSFHASQH
jgi:nucleoside-diphosphate-sugar epimerase